MPVTTKYALPYPSLDDPPNGPVQLQNLAERIETVISPVGSELPSFIGYASAAQSLASATLTPLALGAEVLDTHNGHDNVTNNTRYTCQLAGLYHVTGQVAFAINATGARALLIYKNAAEMTPGIRCALAPPTGNDIPTLVASGLVQLGVGDYLELRGYQNSGTTLTTYNGSYTALHVHYVRP